MRNENETMYMFGQESHVASSLPPAQISPVILVCPLRMHPSLFLFLVGVLKWQTQAPGCCSPGLSGKGNKCRTKSEWLRFAVSPQRSFSLLRFTWYGHILLRRSTCLLLQSVLSQSCITSPKSHMLLPVKPWRRELLWQRCFIRSSFWRTHTSAFLIAE